MNSPAANGFQPQLHSVPVPLIDLVTQYEQIKDEVMEAVERVMSSQRFVLGDEVAEFECDVAEYVDSVAAIGCASGTDALILALQALEIGPGDEVITSPFSFFATASCIERVGAKPIFVDIEADSFNLDPAAVADAVTPRTKAIIPVHLFGQCAEMEPLWRLATKHNLAIVEDGAQAIGASYRGRRAGVLGSIGCFSFFPTKNLGGAGDGGIMTTDDLELAQRLRRLRVHGDAGRYEHVDVGMNSRLDALQAAILKVKLKHLDHWNARRNENAEHYATLIPEFGIGDVIQAPVALPQRDHVYNQYCVTIKDGLRDDVMNHLRSKDIGCAVYYPKPLHLQPCFAHHGYQAGQFPVSERTCEEILALPVVAEIDTYQVETVVRCMAEAVEQAHAVSHTSTATPQKQAA